MKMLAIMMAVGRIPAFWKFALHHFSFMKDLNVFANQKESQNNFHIYKKKKKKKWK